MTDWPLASRMAWALSAAGPPECAEGELEAIHEVVGNTKVGVPLAIFTDNAANLFDNRRVLQSR